MLRQLAFVTLVAVALAACASDEEPTTETAASGATTVPSTPGGGAGGVEGGRLPGSTYPGGGTGAGAGTVAQAQQQVTQAGDTVFFAYDRFDLDDRAQRTLDAQASILLRYPQVNVVVEGHADERGTREYNLALGERRANAVKEYLVALGVNPSRVRAVSYGEERPKVAGSTEAAWAQNRRAVTVVVTGAPVS